MKPIVYILYWLVCGSFCFTAKARPSPSAPDTTAIKQEVQRKMAMFSMYLAVLADKEANAQEKDRAVEEATNLFQPAATVNVTQTNRPHDRRYKVSELLTRLKLLPYTHISISIVWFDVLHVKQLYSKGNGLYSATISGHNSSQDRGEYSDILPKDMQVELQYYRKKKAKPRQGWNALLGDISVAIK